MHVSDPLQVSVRDAHTHIYKHTYRTTRTPDLREENTLSMEEDWATLSFDTVTLGVRSGVIQSATKATELHDVIKTCATQAFELLFWTPDADVGAELHGKEWFTGYVTAKAVEFQLRLASSHMLALIPKETVNPDFMIAELASAAAQEDFNDLVDLALIAGHHARYRRDPTLTQAQFKSLYTAWLRNSMAQLVADHTCVVRRKEGGKAVGFITIKLSRDEGGASFGLLGVSPSCQRQGLGTALMSAACALPRTQV